ncbi:MAG: LysR substrate-binding domain-containing protein [Rhodospirillaceae bacterium]
MPTNLDIDLLRSLVTIVDTGSFTRAAERLGRTQSTISLQVQRLEEMIGRRLLQRSAHHLLPTAEGEILLASARRILALNDDLVARVTEPAIAGSVRLGTPEDFATVYLAKVLADFTRSHPRVALEVCCDFTFNLLNAFAAGELDLTLVKREPQGDVGGVRVWRERLVWAGLDRTPLAHDQTVPMVLSPQPCVYRKRAILALDGAGRRWRIAYVSPSLAGLQAAVRAGLGITVLPLDMLPAGFEVLGPADGFPDLDDTEIALLVAPGTQSPPARLLAEHIVKTLEAPRAPPRPEQGLIGRLRRGGAEAEASSVR